MTVVVDTGGMIALVDADDRHHRAVRAIYEADPRAWVLPWAILPEVDYLLARHVGADAAATMFVGVVMALRSSRSVPPLTVVAPV